MSPRALTLMPNSTPFLAIAVTTVLYFTPLAASIITLQPPIMRLPQYHRPPFPMK